MLPDDIYSLNIRHVQPDGTMQLHPAGRFLVRGGQVSHLDDYHGLLARIVPEGPADDAVAGTVNRLHGNPYLELHTRSEVLQGHHHGELSEADIPDPPPPEAEARPPSVFHYERVGMDRPHVLEAKGGSATIDGNALSDDELRTVIDNVHNGVATIRYRPSPAASVQKMEAALEPLAKDEADQSDGDDPGAEARQLLLDDGMIPGVGNQLAFRAFQSHPQPGVMLAMDGNGWSDMNQAHGYAAGDDAMRTVGNMAIKSLEETAEDPDKLPRLFRTGGDKFAVQVPTMEQAAKFLRVLRGKLEEVPPIGGDHRLSLSTGLGPDYKTAQLALEHAKLARNLHLAATGATSAQAPHFAHSLVPGMEGPIPFAEANPMRAPGHENLKLDEVFPPPPTQTAGSSNS